MARIRGKITLLEMTTWISGPPKIFENKADVGSILAPPLSSWMTLDTFLSFSDPHLPRLWIRAISQARGCKQDIQQCTGSAVGLKWWRVGWSPEGDFQDFYETVVNTAIKNKSNYVNLHLNTFYLPKNGKQHSNITLPNYFTTFYYFLCSSAALSIMPPNHESLPSSGFRDR